jgi:hypothetical protein
LETVDTGVDGRAECFGAALQEFWIGGDGSAEEGGECEQLHVVKAWKEVDVISRAQLSLG